MKGITPIQYTELLEWIRQNHRFGKSSKKFPMGIKYISATYDTRTGSIYRIVLHKFFDESDIVLTTTNIIKKDERANFSDLAEYTKHYLTN